MIGVSLFAQRAPPRTVCGAGMVVCSVGTAAPALHLSIATLILSAACVGGTFILVTLAGIREGRRIAPGAAARIVAAMTSAFAVGQLVGPLLGLFHAGTDTSAATAMRLPSLVAATVNVVAAIVLLADRPAMDARR